jgi:predicted kinase
MTDNVKSVVYSPPVLLMLVGMPASGKTTYIKNEMSSFFNGSSRRTVVISTDNWIENYGADRMKTYNEVFAEAIKPATLAMELEARNAISGECHIIWDQTNLTVKGRAVKLAKIPKIYFKRAVVLSASTEEEWRERLEGRPGKNIPEHILDSMRKSYQGPTIAEGFDVVHYVFN